MLNSYVFLGNSGVGKDTAIEAIQVIKPCVLIHPIRSIKRFYECYYGFQPGDFDTPYGKNQLLSPSANVTVQEFQVKLFKLFEEVDPQVSGYGLKRSIMDVKRSEAENVAFSGIRYIHEAELVNEYLPKTRWFLIERPGKNGLESDKHLKEVVEYVKMHTDLTIIKNDGGVLQFMEKVRLLTSPKPTDQRYEDKLQRIRELEEQVENLLEVNERLTLENFLGTTEIKEVNDA